GRDPVGAAAFALAPDGERVALATASGLRVARLGGPLAAEVFASAGPDATALAWLPDGRILLAAPAVPLRIADAASGEATELDASSGGVRRPVALAVAPDG